MSLKLRPPRYNIINNFHLCICLFLSVAAHIEEVTCIYTETILAALRGFNSRRKKQRNIRSDSAFKFQIVAIDHHALYKMFLSTSQKVTVQDYLDIEDCELNFIPPHETHFDWIWQATVKSKNYHLRITLGSPVATFQELGTLLAEIETWLNFRSFWRYLLILSIECTCLLEIY